jgi:hypothetical protein
MTRWNDNDVRWKDVLNERWTIYKNLPDYTHQMIDALLADENNAWYTPISTRIPHHDVFELCYMKFPLENYNTIDIESMIMLANGRLQYKWKQQFAFVENFINEIRPIIGQTGPLGKISFWKIPAGLHIKEHNDDFPYHVNVTRWIYNISHNHTYTDITMNSNKISSDINTIFPLFTPTDFHMFRNKSEDDWYFLAIDFWNQDKLVSLTPSVPQMDKWALDPSRHHLINNL